MSDIPQLVYELIENLHACAAIDWPGTSDTLNELAKEFNIDHEEPLLYSKRGFQKLIEDINT